MQATGGDTADTALSARVITDVGQLQPLRPHWDRLLRATPDATPWQSLHWLLPWWQRLRGRRRLMIVAVYRGQEPCLVLPLQLATFMFLRMPLRLLEPIGMPDDINRPALALGTPDCAALDCALQALWQHRAAWDGLRIDEKTPDDAEVTALVRFARRHRLPLRTAVLHPCPRLDLRQDWPTYLGTRGRRLQKNLRAARRRLEDTGALSLEVVETPDDIAAAFDTFLGIHARSWKHAAGLGLGQSDAYRQCYRSFLQAMAERRSARVLILRAGTRAVAGAVALMDDTTYYAAQIAHDTEFDRASPGTLLEAMELEGLMREGRWRHYDFFGAALNNKRRWTDDLRATCRVLLLRRGLRAMLFDAWYFHCKPALHRLRAALPQRKKPDGDR